MKALWKWSVLSVFLFGCGKQVIPNPEFLTKVIGTWEIDIEATLNQPEVLKYLNGPNGRSLKNNFEATEPLIIDENGSLNGSGEAMKPSGAGIDFLQYGTAFLDGDSINDAEIFRLELLDSGLLRMRPNIGLSTLFKRSTHTKTK